MPENTSESQQSTGLQKNTDVIPDDEIDSKIMKLTAENINDFLSKNKSVVIDFYSDTCPPCKRMKPIINELADEFAGKIIFAKVHTKEQPSIAKALQIRAHPTFYFFHEELPILFFIGEKTKSDFIQLMKLQFPNLKET